MQKKSVHSTYSFMRQSILESRGQTSHTHVNYYQHAKNQAISLIESGDMLD